MCVQTLQKYTIRFLSEMISGRTKVKGIKILKSLQLLSINNLYGMYDFVYKSEVDPSGFRLGGGQNFSG